MGRNDLCFCGSDKKQKKCHPNINENSVAAKTIKLYGDIGKDLETYIYGKVDVKCVKGCNKCCQDYFAISEIEFAIIMDYLYNKLGSEKTNEIIQKGILIADEFEKNNPEYYEKLNECITGKSLLEWARLDFSNMPEKQEKCVFLDDNGGCSIYEVRPLICRTHGLCYYSGDVEHKICDKIPSFWDSKENMIPIDKYQESILLLKHYQKEGKENVIYRRQYPIVYFMKLYFGDGRTLSEYFKFPVVYNILHGTEEQLYDCICYINGIK